MPLESDRSSAGLNRACYYLAFNAVASGMPRWRARRLNGRALYGMRKFLNWRVFMATITVLAGLALVASHFLGVPLLLAFGILVAAVLVNGFVATVEDDLPGGFNNPDGTLTPIYAQTSVRIA